VSDYAVRELPLFPLPDVVLFPQQLLPLHIFESRYRMLLQSVLESDKRFGVVRIDPETREMAEVGCCAEVLQHLQNLDNSPSPSPRGHLLRFLCPLPSLSRRSAFA
jgi:ATP-dependent Lon protease